jgi:hypothetical protein
MSFVKVRLEWPYVLVVVTLLHGVWKDGHKLVLHLLAAGVWRGLGWHAVHGGHSV